MTDPSLPLLLADPPLTPEGLLTVSILERDDGLLVCLSGELDTFTTPVLLAALLPLRNRGIGASRALIEIDLSALAFLDSSGLTALISARTELSGTYRQVRLTRARPSAQWLLDFARVSGWFEATTR